MPSSDDSYPYGTPSLRYSLRMRPFLPLSLPEVPSYADFKPLFSLRPEDNSGLRYPDALTTEIKTQLLITLDVADQAMKTARKEWDIISKAHPETAKCLGCEDWWRGSMKDVVRACIAGNIAVATAKKTLLASDSDRKHPKDLLNVRFPEKDRRYHAWWVVPSISSV